MNWDNTLVSALATICSAAIGAAGTIIAALISKAYVGQRMKSAKDILKPNPLTTSLLKIFRFFRVIEAVTFLVMKDVAYIDNETGIMIALTHISADEIGFEYQLPSHNESQTVQNARPGWRRLLKYQGSLYALTLIGFHWAYHSSDTSVATFDFRNVIDEMQPA